MEKLLKPTWHRELPRTETINLQVAVFEYWSVNCFSNGLWLWSRSLLIKKLHLQDQWCINIQNNSSKMLVFDPNIYRAWYNNTVSLVRHIISGPVRVISGITFASWSLLRSYRPALPLRYLSIIASFTCRLYSFFYFFSFHNLFINAVSLPFLLLKWTLTSPTGQHFVLLTQLKNGSESDRFIDFESSIHGHAPRLGWADSGLYNPGQPHSTQRRYLMIQSSSWMKGQGLTQDWQWSAVLAIWSTV